MKDIVYLVCTVDGVVRMRHKRGEPKPGEVIIEVRVGVDPRVFFPKPAPVDIQVGYGTGSPYQIKVVSDEKPEAGISTTASRVVG